MGLTEPDAWVICTAIVCVTVLIIFFRINRDVQQNLRK
jgi:hypothetical protein